MPRVKSVFFGPSASSHGTGQNASVAIHSEGLVLEVVEKSGNLSYRFGRVDGVQLIWQGDPVPFDTGTLPSVVISKDKDVIVVYSENNALFISLGQIPAGDASIGFSSLKGNLNPQNTPPTSNPSVAINDAGVLIEVHESLNGIYYQRGLLGSDRLVRWNDPQRQLSASGINPFVAINNNGMAVTVYELSGQLFYSVGSFDPTRTAKNEPITWTMPADYDTGTAPSIALTDDGYVFEVHGKTAGSANEIHQRIGRIIDNAIVWQDVLTTGNQSMRYDTGVGAQIATNGRVAIQVHADAAGGSANLLANASLVFDRANWMGDAHGMLSSKSLRRIAIPGSHDTGTTNADKAQTQDLPMSGQLAYGVRYFDLRVLYRGNKNTTINTTAVQNS